MEVLGQYTPSMSAPRPTCITRAQFDRLVASGTLDEDDRVELIAGIIYAPAPPGPKHIARVNRLQKSLIHALKDRAIISTQNPIALSEFSEPQPDIAVLKPVPDYYESRLADPADVFFVVEVSDSSIRFDRDTKMPLYAACDIQEAWLLDVTERRVTVYRKPEGNRYTEQMSYGPAEQIPLTAFPGESIAASDLGL
jgi:Uma2 family endonuclease